MVVNRDEFNGFVKNKSFVSDGQAPHSYSRLFVLLEIGSHDMDVSRSLLFSLKLSELINDMTAAKFTDWVKSSVHLHL